jgi:hypothetical protein
MTEQPVVVVSPLRRLPMTKALKALIAEVTGKPCEIRRIPQVPKLDPKTQAPVVPESLVPVDPPFTILHPITSVYSGPGLVDVHADVVWTYQAQIATLRGDQAEVFHGKVIEAIVGQDADGRFVHPLDVPGMVIMARTLGIENNDEEGMSTDVQFDIHVTPVRAPLF